MKAIIKSKFFVVSSALLAVSISLIILSSQAWFKELAFFSPVRNLIVTAEKVVAGPRKWLVALSDDMDNLLGAAEENKLLKRKVQLLEDLERTQETLSAENESLRASLNLSHSYQKNVQIAAEVIHRSPASWNQTLLISKGETSGVNTEFLAVANGGLVGLVSEVDSDSALLELLVDDTSEFHLAVKINSEHRVYGILSGYDRENGVFIVSQLNEKGQIKADDQVVTSDLSVQYPSNILVGRVIEVRENKDSLETEVVIDPAADFSNLYSLVLVGPLK